MTPFAKPPHATIPSKTTFLNLLEDRRKQFCGAALSAWVLQIRIPLGAAAFVGIPAKTNRQPCHMSDGFSIITGIYDDAGGKVAGTKIEVVCSDHANKPDIAANLARDDGVRRLRVHPSA